MSKRIPKPARKSNPGPVVFPQNNGNSSGSPVNPDGSPNYGSIPTGGGGSGSGSAPVDPTGAIDIWNLPQSIFDYEKFNAKPFWFDVGHKDGGHIQKRNDLSPDFSIDKKTGKPVSKGDTVAFDVNMSAEQLMKQYAAMSQNNPIEFAALQKQLAAGGWFGNASQVYGGWNQQTENALANAMVQYLKVSHGAGVGIDFHDFLGNSVMANQGINGNPGAGGGGGGAGSGLPSRPTLTDPDTLKLYAQKAAQAALGRNLTPDQLDLFVNQFHQQQTDSFNNALKGKGDVIDKADPRASAIQFVASNNQQEAGQHQVLGYADALLNSMMSGSAQMPTPNVDPTAVTY